MVHGEGWGILRASLPIPGAFAVHRHPRALVSICAQFHLLIEPVTDIHHLRACTGYRGGMARQRKAEKRIATAVRIPESIHHQLQDQAELRDVSVNFLVVRAVTQYLQNAPDPLALEDPVARSA